MMPRLFLAVLAVGFATLEAGAGSVHRSYSYFSIGGQSLSDIEMELQRRGPELSSTGARHPGATRMEFKTRIGYGETAGRCGVVEASVSIAANMILPRWRNRARAEADVGLMWDTLSADIRRHEEGHIVIARNFARQMEREFLDIRPQPDCEQAAARVQETSAALLDAHDKEQERYDRVESINFESRMLRLLQYRLERIESGQIPG